MIIGLFVLCFFSILAHSALDRREAAAADAFEIADDAQARGESAAGRHARGMRGERVHGALHFLEVVGAAEDAAGGVIHHVT